jgi:hypothetical protein
MPFHLWDTSLPNRRKRVFATPFGSFDPAAKLIIVIEMVPWFAFTMTLATWSNRMNTRASSGNGEFTRITYHFSLKPNFGDSAFIGAPGE